jgi:hypothetical protein
VRRFASRLFGSDRALLIGITGLWPSLLGAVQVVQPGDHPALAPRWFQNVLALEIA